MTDIVKLRSEGRGDNFSFIRFAEWRPETLSAEITVEIPTLAQFLMDQYFTAVTFHIWLELTSITIKNLENIGRRIEDLLDQSFSSVRGSFRKFPPSPQTFGLTLHIMLYNSSNGFFMVKEESWTGEELKSSINRGFAWDFQKRINTIYTEQCKTDWDNSHWDLAKCLDVIKSMVKDDDDSKCINVHGILISGWHTTGSFDQVLDSQENWSSTLSKLKISFFLLIVICLHNL